VIGVSGRRGVSWFGAAIGVIAFAACTSDAEGIKPIHTEDAYVAAINWYVDSLPAPPPTTNGDEPGPVIVYVVTLSGKAIDSQVQASVVADMADRKDDVTVRFADVRDDALEVDEETQPVKDEGVLLLVGEVEEANPPINVDVEVYRDMNDVRDYDMKIFRSGDEVTATAETVVAPG
jgi:hypothetical protein